MSIRLLYSPTSEKKNEYMTTSCDAAVKNIMRIFFFMSKLSFLTRVSYFPIYNFYQRAILSIKILVTQNIWDYFGLT